MKHCDIVYSVLCNILFTLSIIYCTTVACIKLKVTFMLLYTSTLYYYSTFKEK